MAQSRSISSQLTNAKTRGKLDLPRVSYATPELTSGVALLRFQPGDSMIG